MKKRKRYLKKILGTFAAVAMTAGIVSGSAVSARADDPTYSITIKNENPHVSINGKQYKAYKVFDATLGFNVNETKASRFAYTIKSSDWAYPTLVEGVTPSTTDAFTTKYGLKLTPTGTVNDVTTYNVEENTFNDENARKLADALTSVVKLRNADGTSEIAANETATISVTTPGYYAVYGTADAKENKSGSQELVAAVGLTTTNPDVQVNPKVDAPTLDKKITGVSENGTNKADTLLGNGKAVTAQVGSVVHFELDGVVPDLTGYSFYTYTISDKLSDGLDYVATTNDKSNVVVKIGETTIASDDYTVNFAEDKKMTITLPYNTLYAVTKGDIIKVTYDATVNENALNHNYEKNTASLTYSNDPSSSENIDTTPDKETYVTNFNINVNKIANGDKSSKLPDAKFKLYKGNTGTGNVWYKWNDSSKTVTWVSEDKADTFTTNSQGTFNTAIRGLDVGTYSLVETEAPAGYNKLAKPVEVNVSATIKDDGIVYFSVSENDNKVNNGTVNINQNPSEDRTVVILEINNNSGTILPSTGGIGTTIFYIAGGVLIIGAAALLINRKKKANA